MSLVNFGRNNPDNSKNLEELNNDVISDTVDSSDSSIEQEPETTEPEPIASVTLASEESDRPNTVDGWKTIDHDNMPNRGVYYPSSWNFAYRCPKAKEVVNFSAINENDIAAVYAATEDLIRKCVKIWDNDSNKEIAPSEINDNDRFFFMLKLREFYVSSTDAAIKMTHICPTCSKEYEEPLYADSLKWKMPNDTLLEAYDGRIFTLEMGDRTIKFRIPTISTTGRIFRQIVQLVRDQQNGRKTNDSVKHSKYVTDQVFLKISPFLFVNGRESFNDIINKYKSLEKDDELLEIYSNVIDSIELANYTYIDGKCPYCEAEDAVDITFPGYRTFFKKSIDKRGYFTND